jgi:hypothetical protein
VLVSSDARSAAVLTSASASPRDHLRAFLLACMLTADNQHSPAALPDLRQARYVTPPMRPPNDLTPDCPATCARISSTADWHPPAGRWIAAICAMRAGTRAGLCADPFPLSAAACSFLSCQFHVAMVIRALLRCQVGSAAARSLERAARVHDKMAAVANDAGALGRRSIKDHLRDTVGFCPSDPVGWLYAARGLYKRQDYHSCAEAVSYALRSDKTMREAQHLLAFSLLQTGQVRVAPCVETRAERGLDC